MHAPQPVLRHLVHSAIGALLSLDVLGYYFKSRGTITITQDASTKRVYIALVQVCSNLTAFQEVMSKEQIQHQNPFIPD